MINEMNCIICDHCGKMMDVVIISPRQPLGEYNHYHRACWEEVFSLMSLQMVAVPK